MMTISQQISPDANLQTQKEATINPITSSDPSANNHIVIVGTGFSGLGMAIRLKMSGIDDFTVFEQAAEVGGTWRDNHYPGAACDVQSHLYSFSFEKNPRWSRSFAPQAEILNYLKHCADKYDVRRHIEFNTGVAGATYNEESGLWSVTTSQGKTVTARVLVSGCGGLSRPAYPDIPGIEDFKGKMFHSARWDHEFELKGKKVAVIGTGASAIQVVPAIADKVGELKLFQRTAPWILPKPDRAYGALEKRAFNALPGLMDFVRGQIYAKLEARVVAFSISPKLMKFGEAYARKFINDSVADPELRKKLTPNFTLGCKRVLMSNDYYPALQRENAEVITDGIDRITQSGILTKSGREVELDAIVLSTGFQAADAIAPFDLFGIDGVKLDDAWAEKGAEAYKGSSIAGYPNFFTLMGPNTGLGHSSMVYIIESQIEYALKSIKMMRARKLHSMEVRQSVQDKYNVEIQKQLGKTVWASGCNSWYFNSEGKNTTLWPGFTFAFRRQTMNFRAADYLIRSGDEVVGSMAANSVGV